jgi:hypothetical protein
MEHCKSIQRVLVQLRSAATCGAWPGLFAIIVFFGLSGCAAQGPAVGAPTMAPAWAQAGSNPQSNGTPAACGSAATVQPLDVNAVGDPELSNRITTYLKDHCLPLARASIARQPDGAREVLLYGFVASDFGKRDAEEKTAALLANSGIPVKNTIMVRPDLAALQTQPGNAPDSAAEKVDQSNSLAQQNAIQQYQNQNQSGLAGILAPLLGLGMLGGSFGGGSGVIISPGVGTGWYPGVGPGFGYSPVVNPYFAAPMGSTPFGFQPFP